MNWAGLALLSACFAGLTNILAKRGMTDLPTNLGTLIRTLVVVVFATTIVLAKDEMKAVKTITAQGWTFLVLSGLATGLSWLFYFAALQKGNVSQVAPIDKLSFVIAMILGILFLKEQVKPLTFVGAGLILCGVMLTLDSVQTSILRFFHIS